MPLKPRSDGNKSDLEAGGGGSDSHGSEAEEVEEEEKVPLPEVPTPVRNADGLYACEHCDYSCKKGSHMKRHVLVVHLGIRRYHCKHCNRRYADHGGLKQHLITTHRIDPSNLPVYFQPVNVNAYCKNGLLWAIT